VKKRLPGCVFLFMGSLFPFIGAIAVEMQRRQFARLIEVPAEIVGQDVGFHETGDGMKTYGPVIKLRYLADGMPPAGEGIIDSDMWTPGGPAADPSRDWPVGKRVTAWADPDHLERAWLVRQVSPLPYLIILFPVIFMAFGVMFLLFPGEEGKKAYEPGTPWAWRTFLIVWNLVGIASAVHYFSQPGAWQAGGIALFGIYLGIGFLPVVLQLRRALRKA